MNDEAVYRTAPATPGLLNMLNRATQTQMPRTLGWNFPANEEKKSL